MAISVLIVTYNIKETIGECLESLCSQSYKDFEVILVDNNSNDGTREIVDSFERENRLNLKKIYSNINTGFCRGNNIALEIATGKYVALLNPDARADVDWLKVSSENLESHRDVGICTSKILTWDGKNVDSAGDMMLGTFRAFKRESRNPDLHDEIEYVFGACAAGAVYRKEMIDKIGFFDEDFFLQCEDTDLSFRAQLAGWKVLYVPTAKVYHKVTQSIKKVPTLGIYYSQRNMEFVRIKNAPFYVLLIHLPQMFLGLIIDFLYFGVRRNNWRIFVKAKVDAIRLLPRMLRKRKLIQSKKVVADKYIRKLLTPVGFNNMQFFLLKFKRFLE